MKPATLSPSSIGAWTIAGTIDAGGAGAAAGGAPAGSVLPFVGSARASIDDRYFVNINLNFIDPRSNEQVTGTAVISQTGGRGLELTTAFSSHPEVRRYRGEMDASGSVLDFTQSSPPGSARRIIMRLSPGRTWSADVWDGNRRIEALTFTWAGP